MLTRRRALAVLASAAAPGASGCVSQSLLRLKPERDGSVLVPASALDALSARGALSIRAGEMRAVIRRQGGELVAVAPVCTHRSCALVVLPDGYECPCHGSSFTRTGEVRSGPAIEALGRFRSVREAAGLRLFPG